ncbi:MULTISPECIES: MFS transporter [Photorhabdus]|uniref:Cytoplasmic transmembrane protein n=2 Tax=Photorhabdus asymbiotica TaxID=291112 RepID=B6VKV3_PHOAA|nr:MFS transporter [Photorhabdus asymbiotica]RKS57249.1 MFS transporter (putative signal transducer) [Photorhabdus asymbiotica]CAQ84391.1 putative cytoplasmic transmembrane protein [Photorhabdus asymbiotica]CAR66783.1 putative cytoplasmic transmembrane protein [Photorhabdus asymbiotica subsp. asymbiotica ATCC 43949]
MMHNISHPRHVSLLLLALAGVYTIQSTIGMLTLQSMPAFLRSHGVTPDKIGLLYLLMLPWAFKFLWAPIVERYRKSGSGDTNSRRIMLCGNVLITLLFCSMSLAEPAEHMPLIITGLFLITLCLTVVDTTTDGHAIDRLSPQHRPWSNVMQVGGSYLGSIIGSGLFLYLTSLYGWHIGAGVLAILILVMSLPVLFIKETPEKKASNISKTAVTPSLKSALRRAPVKQALILILLCMIGTRLSLGMLSPFLIDRGVDLTQLGIIAASGGALAGLSGVLLGGIIVRKLGSIQTLLGLMLFECMVLVGIFWLAQQPEAPLSLLSTAYVFITLITAAKFVALYTQMMSLAAGTQSGVDFALMQSADMSIAIICSVLGGMIVTKVSYASLFALASFFTLTGLFWTFHKFRDFQKENVNAQ